MYIKHTEYYRKRANIIEELKDCKIKLFYTKESNFVLKEKPDPNVSLRTYTVNIQTPNDPSIPTKTAVYHELSHVLWDSFMNGSFAILDKWAKETTLNLFHRKQIIPQGNSTTTHIPNHIQRQMSDIQKNLNQYIQSIYKSCFNCLEDQRIESLTRQIWLATENMFDQAKNQLGQKLDDEILSPSEHLLAARFNRPELTNSNYIEAMKDVEETGKTGTITVMHKIKDLIDKDIQDRFENYFANLKGIVDDAREATNGNSRPLSSEYEDARKEFDKDLASATSKTADRTVFNKPKEFLDQIESKLDSMKDGLEDKTSGPKAALILTDEDGIDRVEECIVTLQKIKNAKQAIC